MLGGAARGNYWVGPNMSIQLDVQAEGTSYDTGFVRLKPIVARLPDRRPRQLARSRPLLWGAFAGIGDVSPAAARHAVFGGEGQYYMGQFTFYGQLGYDTTLHRVILARHSSAPSWNRHQRVVRARHRPVLRHAQYQIEATGMYANGEMDRFVFEGKNTWDFETLLWEAKAEWKMDHNPFAFFFKYRGSRTDYSSSLTSSSGECGNLNTKVTDNRFLVGARMYLGEGTLLWNDRKGTTLDIIAPLAIQSGPL